MHHRVFLFSFNSNEEALRFVELLSEHLRGANIIIDLKGTTVKVRVYGSRSDIKSTFLKIKDLVTIVKGERGEGLKKYSLRYLLTSSELKAPIPIDLIRDVLALKEFKVEIKRGYVITDASLEEVRRTIERISEIYSELRSVRASPRAKKVIALMSSLTELSVGEALKVLLDNGVIRTVEGAGTYALTCKYEVVLEVVRKLLKEMLK